MICNDIYKEFRSFYIVMPAIEDLKDYKEFLVMYVIVEFDNLEYIRMKYDWIDFFFFYYN